MREVAVRNAFSVDNSVHNIVWKKEPAMLWAHLFMSMEDTNTGTKHTYIFELTNLMCFKNPIDDLGCETCTFLFLE